MQHLFMRIVTINKYDTTVYMKELSKHSSQNVSLSSF